MSTPIGTNMAEYATELPQFATESLDLVKSGPELRKHDFPGGIYGCVGPVFWHIRLIRVYSALYSNGFLELFGTF